MLASCAILDKAHDQAIALLGLNYNGRDLCLAELHERLDPTLAANEIVACSSVSLFRGLTVIGRFRPPPWRYSARSLENCAGFGGGDLETEFGQSEWLLPVSKPSA
jgi:hypothetical protein